jgi:thiol-disulfide isomerase/thioredoxin
MNRLSIFGLAAAGILLVACQSKTYKIEGSGNGIKNGDTLYLTNDLASGAPTDTIIVKEGKFSIEGESDSTYLCLLYNAQHREINVPFFIEPGGKIAVTISEEPGMSRVSGTTVNNQWQALNDSILILGKRINRIATYIYGNNLSEAEKEEQIKQINLLNGQFKACVLSFAEKNISNEFGYFILTYYDEDIIEPDKRIELINKLPTGMQNRQAIRSIKERLQAASQIREGAKVTDFTMNDLDGKRQSFLSLIAKNKITVIDFWASWCGPCLQEMPVIVNMYNTYKEKGLGIIGISLDNNQQKWKDATKQFGITWPQLSDLKGWKNEAAQLFNIQSIPQTIVVDQNGTILKIGLRGSELEHFISTQIK